jgi:hypothetical protein
MTLKIQILGWDRHTKCGKDWQFNEIPIFSLLIIGSTNGNTDDRKPAHIHFHSKKKQKKTKTYEGQHKHGQYNNWSMNAHNSPTTS